MYKIKAYEQMRTAYLTMTNKPNNNIKIRQNKCLVHRVPSGVAILSQVGGIAAIVHHTQCVCVCVSGKYGETRSSCLFISGKKEWESSPSILVTRNPNWSQRSGTETGCVKRRY